MIVSGSTPSTFGDGRITVEASGRPPSATAAHPLDRLAAPASRPRLPSHLERSRPRRLVLGLADRACGPRCGRRSTTTGRPGARGCRIRRQTRGSARRTRTRGASHRVRPGTARALYLATVAHSLRVDINRLVPWSLDDLNGDELDALLASTSLFWWNADQTGLRDLRVRSWMGGAGLAADVLVVPGLAASPAADAPRHRDRARRLGAHPHPLRRSRSRATTSAITGGTTATCRCRAPLRARATRVRCSPRCRATIRCATTPRGARAPPGCFASVLRAANIPVRPRSVSNDSTPHATLLFLSEDRALTHGDDPYSPLVEGADPAELADRACGPTRNGSDLAPRTPAATSAARPWRWGWRAFRPSSAGPTSATGSRGSRPNRAASIRSSRAASSWPNCRRRGSGNGSRQRRRRRPAWQMGACPGRCRTCGWRPKTVPALTSAGSVEAQALDPALLGMWRNRQQLRWRGARPGA